MTYPGFIYLAFNPTHDLHKVGRTLDAKNRMRSLTSEWGTRWRLMHSFQVDDMRMWESYLLDVFGIYHYHVSPKSREYFELPNEAVGFFLSIPKVLGYSPNNVWWDYANPFSHPSWQQGGSE